MLPDIHPELIYQPIAHIDIKSKGKGASGGLNYQSRGALKQLSPLPNSPLSQL